MEGAMMKTVGVKSAKVLFNASKVKAEFDENVVNANQLLSKIEKLGYPVQSSKIIASK
ncbi:MULTISPECIES: heavy-metal-associated domain-containing protein [Lactococcus]|uniref:heavy-metal-associated domain-containing protein n=1 Tax=Lactococcus TaxID=1357 RepID=UPI001A8E8F30|nr:MULTISPECIES: heavy-metal-associated domain-containing protein [unclassified Lactococcus]MCH1713936.1 copper chaperone [Lactococcus petauri]QSR05065.1 heavy-metal-associated domain-containing protein [Lactococcus sp. LG1267]QSR11799.1 heavy-metal-associated domain-containing protein [Lactococcus sp. LG592]